MVAAYDGGNAESELIEFETTEQWVLAQHQSIAPDDAATIMERGAEGESIPSLLARKCDGITLDFTEAKMRTLKIRALAQPFIAELCRMDFGWDICFDPKLSLRRNRERPYLACSLDAWMIEDDQHVAIHVLSLSEWFGRSPEAKDNAALRHVLKIQQQLAVTGWQKAYSLAIQGFDLAANKIERTGENIEVMLPRCDLFWSEVLQRRDG